MRRRSHFGALSGAILSSAQVKKKFPDTETKLLVACNNGRTYTMDALMALDEEGYTNIVGLKVCDLTHPHILAYAQMCQVSGLVHILAFGALALSASDKR